MSHNVTGWIFLSLCMCYLLYSKWFLMNIISRITLFLFVMQSPSKCSSWVLGDHSNTAASYMTSTVKHLCFVILSKLINNLKLILVFCAQRWTPLAVAQSWHRDCLEEILSTRTENRSQLLPSPYLCLPLMNIVKIAR